MQAGGSISEPIVDIDNHTIAHRDINSRKRPLSIDANRSSIKLPIWIGCHPANIEIIWNNGGEPNIEQSNEIEKDVKRRHQQECNFNRTINEEWRSVRRSLSIKQSIPSPKKPGEKHSFLVPLERRAWHPDHRKIHSAQISFRCQT
jgi:hypothetical protein